MGLLAVVAFLAYANGANDTFKGVATLFGSRTTNYRSALLWATGTTLAGSCAAVVLSGALVKAFSGKGLVPDALTSQPAFLLAVGLGAALTVSLATLTGFPISTTHALTGALVGAGLVHAGTVNVTTLSRSFFLPLVTSPLLGFALTGVLYPAFRFLRQRLGVEPQMCLCVEGGQPALVQIRTDGTALLQGTGIRLSVGELSQCVERYAGRVIGIDAQWFLDRLHYFSAAAVGFARGLNDTPKIVALLIAAGGLGLSGSAAMVLIGVLMAIGGLVNSRRVALTLSQRITPMNHGQGFTANAVTACLVIFASRLGLPVSTTHIACGSLFGLGSVTRQGRWETIRSILLAWLVTMPLAALLAAAVSAIVRH